MPAMWGKPMKKSLQILSIICVLGMLVSCGNKTKKKESMPDDSNRQATIDSKQDDYKIAQIAFLMSVDYSQVNEEEPFLTYTMYDQNGDVFYTEDPEITSMQWDLLLEKYADGSISDKLTKVKTIDDKDGMQKCIDNLQAILHNPDYKIVDPGSGPDVNSEITGWEGVYFDENHELKMVYLRYSEYMDHKANDPRADEIIEFLTSN